ncbi:hypothetical protein AALP_AA7G140200 [Arabis alpina]|uniref:Uncharacterized protein n=1 Tax=Arabis alpina TaxID=50452 RepID=A0A087GHY2_ARAAL|nr:hypothetical protein AALP_AA7G140200 [Arabis alpina]
MGHTRDECVRNPKGKEKSLVTWSNSDSKDEERDESQSCEGYFGVIEDDETNLSLIKDNKLMSKHLLKTQDVNKELTSENKQLSDSIKCLRAEYEKIDKEIQSTNLQGIVDQLKLELKDKEEENHKLIANDLVLHKEIEHLKELLDGEKAESEVLRDHLNEQLRNIKMLSKGTKDHEKLLSVGKSGKKQQPQDGMVGRQLDVDQQKSQGVFDLVTTKDGSREATTTRWDGQTTAGCESAETTGCVDQATTNDGSAKTTTTRWDCQTTPKGGSAEKATTRQKTEA